MKDGFKMIGKWKFEYQDENGNDVVREVFNLIPTIAKTAFASQMANVNTKNIGDNLYIACGSNVTAPNASDTQIGTETVRKAISSSSISGPIAYISVSFGIGEATGTHREFGLFGDGNTTSATASANTGILFSHVAVNVVVPPTSPFTCTFQMTFTS